MNIKAVHRGEVEDKRAWPWVLWLIWKNINELLFKSLSWQPEEIRTKAKEEASDWFLAQEVGQEILNGGVKEVVRTRRKWLPPNEDWLTCNIGMEWQKKPSYLGLLGLYVTIEEWFVGIAEGLSRILAIWRRRD